MFTSVVVPVARLRKSAMDELFSQHPGWKLLSKDKLLKTIKVHRVNIPKDAVLKYFEEHDPHQVYTKPKKPKHRFKIAASPYSYQVDVVVLSPYKKQNRGRDRFLLCIEITSKKAFAYTLKSNKMGDVLSAYKSFLEEVGNRPTHNVYGDAFFDHQEFKALNEEHSISVRTVVAKQEHLTKAGGNKLGIVDRMTRTLKSLIQKRIDDSGDVKWTKYLGDLVNLYNDTPHDAFNGKKTPNQAYPDIMFLKSIFREHMKHNLGVKTKVRTTFKPGCKVRVLVEKRRFGKERQEYSGEVYTVESMDGNRFLIKDKGGKVLARRYADSEMIKAKGGERVDVVSAVVKENKVRKRVKEITRTDAKANEALKKAQSNKSVALGVKKKPMKKKSEQPWYVVEGKEKRKREKGKPYWMGGGSEDLLGK